MSITRTMTGRLCGSSLCTGHGVREFYGLCAPCWSKLSPERRAIIRGEEQPVKEIIHHRHVETHYPPPPSRLAKAAFWLWMALVTAHVVIEAMITWMGGRR